MRRMNTCRQTPVNQERKRRWYDVARGDLMLLPGPEGSTIAAWLALISRGVRDYDHVNTRDRRNHHRGVTGPPRRRLAPRAARRGARRDPGPGIPAPSGARGVPLRPRQGARRTGRVAAADQSGGYRPLASHPRPAGRVRRPKTAGTDPQAMERRGRARARDRVPLAEHR